MISTIIIVLQKNFNSILHLGFFFFKFTSYNLELIKYNKNYCCKSN